MRRAELALGVSTRSLERYVRACAQFVTDRAGRSRIEIVRHGDRRLVRLAPRVPARESTSSRWPPFA